MSRIFQLPRQVPIVGGSVSDGAKANFFLTGTTTPTNTYTDAALGTPHANPVVADAAGVFAAIYLDPDVVYKLTLDDTNDALIYTEDPIQDALTQANIGLIFYPRNADEITAGVTPTNYFHKPGNPVKSGRGILERKDLLHLLPPDWHEQPLRQYLYKYFVELMFRWL